MGNAVTKAIIGMAAFCAAVILVSTLASAYEQNETVMVNTSTGAGWVNISIGQWWKRTADCNTYQSWSENILVTVEEDSNCTSSTLNESFKAECGVKVLNMTEAINNLTTTCGPVLASLDEVLNYYDPYVGCVTNLTICVEEMEGVKADCEEADYYKAKWEGCVSDKSSVNASYMSCLAEKNTITSDRGEWKQKAESQNTWLYLLPIIGLIAGFVGKKYWDERYGKGRRPKNPLDISVVKTI